MPYLADEEISLVCQIWHTEGGVLSKPRVQRSKKYKTWYKSLNEKDKDVIDTRVETYLEYGLLVNSKLLDHDYALYEFKWRSGLRVYYSLIEDNTGKLMLLLLGGNKNTQSKDITEAKNIVYKAVAKIFLKKEGLK